MGNKKRAIHEVKGTAVDGERILALRPWIEDHVREEEQVDFSYTKMYWDFDKRTSHFKFKVKFYA